MCGIVGVAWQSGASGLPAADLDRLTQVLRHRGPDDWGVFRDAESPSAPGVALGHTRLSIIDLEGGHQPVANEDQSVWVVFNGEIYNYRELRSELQQAGHRFRTDSDTEVLVHLYEHYGPEGVTRLRGMFAYALWDGPRKRLLVVRDRLGQKPLYYTHYDGKLAFASELKALLQIPGIRREVDPVSLDLYLTYQYVPHPRCILSGFHKLPPAHWGEFQDGQWKIQRYWRPGESYQGERLRDRIETQTRLRDTLTESVRLRLRSDVPVGSFLSGGIDSTIISGLAQQESSQKLLTFSIGFPIERFDERRYAQQAARHLGTDHHEHVVNPEALSVLPRLIWHYDEPFADSSAIPTMALSAMTREFVKVALSGDGGDELFIGYPRYQAVRIAGWIDRLPGPLKKLLGARFWQRLPSSVEQRSPMRRIKRLLEALGERPQRRYLRWISILDSGRRSELYTDDYRARLDGFDAAEFIEQAYQDAWPQDDFVAQTAYVDMLTYLPCDILTKVDIASMSQGLECRSPLLDHHVVDLAVAMPRAWKLAGGQGKRILTETFSDLIPDSIQKRSKMGFGVPLDHWFRNELRELVHDILLDTRTRDRGYFRAEAIQKLLEEHQQQRWDHSARLWNLLCLELWHRMFVDSPPPATCPLQVG